MEEKLKKLTQMIQEADALADRIGAAADGMQVVERNVERMKACLKMMRIGVVEPLEIEG